MTLVCALYTAVVAHAVRAVVCVQMRGHAEVAEEGELGLVVIDRVLVLEHLLGVKNLSTTTMASRKLSLFGPVLTIFLEAVVACVLAFVPDNWVFLLSANATTLCLLEACSVAS